MTELQYQAKCFQWAWENRPQTRRLLFHAANGGKRNAKEAMQLKAAGVVPGVPDFVLISPVAGFELKVAKNIQSADQIKVMQAWRAKGIPYFICRDTIEEFQIALDYVISQK